MSPFLAPPSLSLISLCYFLSHPPSVFLVNTRPQRDLDAPRLAFLLRCSMQRSGSTPSTRLAPPFSQLPSFASLSRPSRMHSPPTAVVPVQHTYRPSGIQLRDACAHHTTAGEHAAVSAHVAFPRSSFFFSHLALLLPLALTLCLSRQHSLPT